MLDHPAETVIDAAAQAGFDGVGLRLSAEHRSDRPHDLHRRAVDLGVVIFDAEVYRVSEAAIDPAPLLDEAQLAGAAALLVVSDLRDVARTAERLAELRAHCDDRGLRLGLEYMAWTTPDEPVAAIDLAERVGCEVIVDVLHHLRIGAGAHELDAVVASGRLGWVQLCDAPATPPTNNQPAALIDEARHRRLVPGHGGLPLAELMGRVPADVTVSIEVQSDELARLDPFERARLLHDASRPFMHA